MRVTVKLWVRDGAFEAFERFENAAFGIMDRHGAKVLSVQKNHGAVDGKPHEIHTLKFKDVAAFESYKADPSLIGMADLRSECIARTEVTIDED